MEREEGPSLLLLDLLYKSSGRLPTKAHGTFHNSSGRVREVNSLDDGKEGTTGRGPVSEHQGLGYPIGKSSSEWTLDGRCRVLCRRSDPTPEHLKPA